jgi:hypothetical protein
MGIRDLSPRTMLQPRFSNSPVSSLAGLGTSYSVPWIA